MIDDIKLDDLQKDALKEYGSICAGNASASLSQMFDRHVKINTHDTEIISIDKAVEIVGGGDVRVLSIEFRIFGEASGKVLIIFTKADAGSFLSILGGGRNSSHSITSVKESMLKETGNIIAGSYMNALASIMKKRIILSMPVITKDTMGSVISENIEEMDDYSENILYMNIEYEENINKIKGTFIILPDKDMMNILLDVTSVKES